MYVNGNFLFNKRDNGINYTLLKYVNTRRFFNFYANESYHYSSKVQIL
jgi:hypothetical protein